MRKHINLLLLAALCFSLLCTGCELKSSLYYSNRDGSDGRLADGKGNNAREERGYRASTETSNQNRNTRVSDDFPGTDELKGAK